MILKIPLTTINFSIQSPWLVKGVKIIGVAAMLVRPKKCARQSGCLGPPCVGLRVHMSWVPNIAPSSQLFLTGLVGVVKIWSKDQRSNKKGAWICSDFL